MTSVRETLGKYWVTSAAMITALVTSARRGAVLPTFLNITAVADTCASWRALRERAHKMDGCQVFPPCFDNISLVSSTIMYHVTVSVSVANCLNHFNKMMVPFVACYWWGWIEDYLLCISDLFPSPLIKIRDITPAIKRPTCMYVCTFTQNITLNSCSLLVA